jgi:hypothetical protein
MSEGLVLRADVPDEGGGHMSVFADARGARAHLRDHVLTSPESGAWALLFEAHGLDYEALVGGVELARREACSRAIFGDVARCQGLYDVYAEQIAQAVSFAIREGWHGAARGQSAYMGVSGVVVFAPRGQIKSAYLPIFHMDEADRPPDHNSAELNREGLAVWRRDNPMYGESFAGCAKRRHYDDVFAPSWRAVSGWLWDRPVGKGVLSNNKATQDTLARALKARWKDRTPHFGWWLKAL